MREEAKLAQFRQVARRALERLLREYAPEDGRATARNMGMTVVGAGMIGLGFNQATNAWMVWVMAVGFE